jgi:hypothetical protein
MDDSGISPKIVHSSQNNSNQSPHQNKIRNSKNSTQRKKFSNKRRSQWHCYIRKCKKKEKDTKKRHCSCCTPKIFLSFCMRTFIKISNTQKQGWARNSMRQYSKDCSSNSNFIEGKLRKNQYAYVSNTAVGNNLFEVNLSSGCKTCINNSKKA